MVGFNSWLDPFYDRIPQILSILLFGGIINKLFRFALCSALPHILLLSFTFRTFRVLTGLLVFIIRFVVVNLLVRSFSAHYLILAGFWWIRFLLLSLNSLHFCCLDSLKLIYGHVLKHLILRDSCLYGWIVQCHLKVVSDILKCLFCGYLNQLGFFRFFSD